MPLKLLRSATIAIKGLAHGVSSERNLKILIFLAPLVVLLSLLLQIPRTDFIIIMLLSAFVISLELINTSIERLIDRLSPRYDKEYGRIKDLMAGAVLLAVTVSAVICFLILYNPVFNAITTLFA